MMSATTKQAKTYAQDGSLESVNDFLHKFSKAAFGRVSDQGLPMTYDDCYQIACVGYTKALAAWKPERARFLTLCYQVVWQTFNQSIEKMVTERARLGLVSVEAMSSGGGGVEIGYELFEDEDENTRPDFILERRQEAQARLERLSPTCRLFVDTFMQSALTVGEGQPEVLLGRLAADMGLAGESLRQLRRELVEVFGLDGLDFRKPKMGQVPKLSVEARALG